MSTQKSVRNRFTSVLATATTALVVASGLALAPTAAMAAPVGAFGAVVEGASAEAAATTLTASVTEATSTGLTISGALTGITGANGAYVALIEEGTSSELSQSNMGIAVDWVTKSRLPDGAGTATFNAKAADLDRTKSYELISWQGHTLPSSETIFNVAPLTVTAAQWEQVFGPVTEVQPTVTVTSSVTDLDPTVAHEVTVKGAGFLPKDPETTGKRQPLQGKFTGAYIAFGSYLNTWKPSESAPANARKNLDVKWGVHASELPIISTQPGAIELAADGTFETTLTVEANATEALEGGQYGIVTYPGGGATYAPFETFTPVTFASTDETPDPEPAVDPAVTATVTSATEAGIKFEATVEGITLREAADVTDTGKADAGVYLALIERDNVAALSEGADAAAAVDFAYKTFIANGAVTRTISAEAKKLDRNEKYAVVSWRAHGNLNDDRFLAQTDLEITDAQWDAVFKKDETKPEVTIPFTDMKKGDKFYKEIAWMFTEGISTGTKQPDNSVKYLPKESVTREAMAAFLFRQYAPANYKEPSSVNFTDVKKGDKFFKEIAWMAASGISTGTKQANNTYKFDPKSEISREAMAAFLYRADETTKPKPLTASPFADMKKGDKFYKEILWMSQMNISTGNANGTKKPNYLPKADVTREAMAAFLYRAPKPDAAK
ncbi:S-layer homology domain-containing protein [Leucobacter sp. HY1908]